VQDFEGLWKGKVHAARAFWAGVCVYKMRAVHVWSIDLDFFVVGNV
jgi:hypothetical protein